jgi:hypothetical protein
VSESTLTRADVTFGKRKTICVPFLLCAHMYPIEIAGKRYEMITVKSAIGLREFTQICAVDYPVTLDVRDAEAGVSALLDRLNAERAEQA